MNAWRGEAVNVADILRDDRIHVGSRVFIALGVPRRVDAHSHGILVRGQGGTTTTLYRSSGATVKIDREYAPCSRCGADTPKTLLSGIEACAPCSGKWARGELS